MSTIQLDWESPEEAAWRKAFARMPRSTVFQCWSWGAAVAAMGDATVRRADILKNGRPVGLVQVFEERRLGLFTLGKVLRGPLFHQPVMPEDRIAALVQLSRQYPLRRLKRFSVLPELPDGPAARGLLRDAGFHAAFGPYETAWLDLTKPTGEIRANLRQNFRNQLVKAETADIRVTEPDDPRPLLAHYETQKHAVGYAAPEGALIAALPDRDLFSLEARMDGSYEPVAAVLFILHGRSATYQVGWTSDRGRAAHAHNLLLWRAISMLADKGIRDLDLGGFDWTHAAGVAHFKAGLGGEPFILPGTYV